jgi:hypothetical protein
MPYFNDDPSLDFDAQEQAMLQMAARIKALRDMKTDVKVTQPEGFKSAVTGGSILAPYVRQPKLSLFSPAIQDYTGNRMEEELNQRRSALTEAEHGGLEKSLANFPQPHTEERIQAGPAGALGEPAEVTVEPTDRERLTHAMGLYRNPQGRPLGQAIMADIAIKGPEREHALRLERMKEEALARQKVLDRKAQIEAAMIRAGGGNSGNFEFNFDDHGMLSTIGDKKTGRIYDRNWKQVGGPPAEGGAPAQGGPPVARAAPAAPAAAAPALAPAPPGKKAGPVLKAEGELQKKIRESNDIISMANQAYPLLAKNPTYGVWGSLKEGATRAAGAKPTESQEAAQQLENLAGQLASKFDRGPGTITDTERKLFVKYMGDIANRSLDPGTRKKALDNLVELVRNSVINAQQAAGQKPATKTASVEGQQVEAVLAPDGQYYVPGPDGKYLRLEVLDDE